MKNKYTNGTITLKVKSLKKLDHNKFIKRVLDSDPLSLTYWNSPDAYPLSDLNVQINDPKWCDRLMCLGEFTQYIPESIEIKHNDGRTLTKFKKTCRD